MATFTVLEAPDGNSDKVVFIREGFSWGAAAFTILWALWRRLWVLSAVLAAVFAAIGVAGGLGLLSPAVSLAVQAGMALLLGMEARGLEILSHERAGYHQAGLIEARSREAAELAYFVGRKPAVSVTQPIDQTVSPAPRLSRPPEDTLGIFGNV